MDTPRPPASHDDDRQRAESTAGQNTSENQIPEISSQDLLQGSREIHIRHGREVYRLRITRNGKLILHK